MTKILLDTSFFLSFYQSEKEFLAVIKQLDNFAELFVFPAQVRDEFLRNRVRLLNRIKEELNKSIQMPYTTSLLKDIHHFRDIFEKIKQAKNKLPSINRSIDEMIENQNKDPICLAFTCLYSSPKSFKIEIDEKIFNLAHRRKLSGNPPSSPDNTIGDEIIWESLLSSCREDLVIVSRDKTYSENFQFLKNEFSKDSGRQLIKVTESVTEALKLLDKTLPRKMEKAEKEHLREEYIPLGYTIASIPKVFTQMVPTSGQVFSTVSSGGPIIFNPPGQTAYYFGVDNNDLKSNPDDPSE